MTREKVNGKGEGMLLQRSSRSWKAYRTGAENYILVWKHVLLNIAKENEAGELDAKTTLTDTTSVVHLTDDRAERHALFIVQPNIR